HGARHREEHLVSLRELFFPRLRGVNDDCGVEVPVVVRDEISNGAHAKNSPRKNLAETGRCPPADTVLSSLGGESFQSFCEREQLFFASRWPQDLDRTR